jgi:integrase
MLKMGCDLKDISDWLGHADIGTTMNIYAHLDMESRRDTANRFASFLNMQSALN